MENKEVPEDVMFINDVEKELWIRGNKIMSDVTFLKTNRWSSKEDKKVFRKVLVEEFEQFIKDYTTFCKSHAKYGFKAKFNVIQLKAVKNMI